MRTETIKIYSFNELSDEAKEKAIDYERNYRYKNGEPLMFFNEVYNEYFTRAGFNGTQIQYSLSYSQGDGLSFSAESYDFLKDLYLEVLGEGKEKTAELLAENSTLIMKGNTGRYCYASTSDIDLYFENYTSEINCLNIDNIESVQGQVLNKLCTIYIDLCKELEDIGYKEIEHYYSDEVIIEDLIDNETEFLETGDLYFF